MKDRLDEMTPEELQQAVENTIKMVGEHNQRMKTKRPTPEKQRAFAELMRPKTAEQKQAIDDIVELWMRHDRG